MRDYIEDFISDKRIAGEQRFCHFLYPVSTFDNKSRHSCGTTSGYGRTSRLETSGAIRPVSPINRTGRHEIRVLCAEAMQSSYPHGYSYDLFVSYSTRDLEWVRVFHDDLVADVNRFADLDIQPFFDKARLQPGYVWDEHLLSAASDSAVLVPVLSPRFFQSDYCQKELNAFLKASGPI